MSDHRTRQRYLSATVAALAGVCVVALGSSWGVGLSANSHGVSQSQAAPTAPASPTAVCVSTTTRTLQIAWTAVAHATSYTIYDSTNGSGGTYNTLISGVTSNPYTTVSLSAGTYYFKVAAYIGSIWAGTRSVATSPGRVISTTTPNCQ